MRHFTRVGALCLSIVLLVAPPVGAAAEPEIYGSLTTYTGSGKHPKTAVVGLIIDGRIAGQKAICYNYTILTNSKVKGQVSAVADRISETGVERLGSFSKMNVLDFTDLPMPPANDNPCDPGPPDMGNFNYGFAADCLLTGTLLNEGDVIRLTFTFQKAAKLKGANAAVNVFGIVLPDAGVAAASGDVQRAIDWAGAMSSRPLPSR